MESTRETLASYSVSLEKLPFCFPISLCTRYVWMCSHLPKSDSFSKSFRPDCSSCMTSLLNSSSFSRDCRDNIKPTENDFATTVMTKWKPGFNISPTLKGYLSMGLTERSTYPAFPANSCLLKFDLYTLLA